MRKGEKTREYIIMQAAKIFNQRGYFGSSISDIMRVTGLQKGGIYRHFDNKDELALEAFDYAIDVLRQRYRKAVEGKKSSIEQLLSVISIYENIIEDPPLIGGCPLLNTAIDSDDSHPALRDKAQKAMDEWLGFVRNILLTGIKRGEFAKDIDVDSVATFITASIEGGVMVSKLYNSSDYMRQTIKNLSDYIMNHLSSKRT